MTRSLWLACGLIATACGIAGVVLPLVPTTPFLLLAVFCFARSSPRLHDWLVDHPRFGPPIANWREHGGISVRAKIAAMAAMALTLIVTWAVGGSAMLLVVQVLVLGAVATFILTRPHGPTDTV